MKPNNFFFFNIEISTLFSLKINEQLIKKIIFDDFESFHYINFRFETKTNKIIFVHQ